MKKATQKKRNKTTIESDDGYKDEGKLKSWVTQSGEMCRNNYSENNKSLQERKEIKT